MTDLLATYRWDRLSGQVYVGVAPDGIYETAEPKLWKRQHKFTDHGPGRESFRRGEIVLEPHDQQDWLVLRTVEGQWAWDGKRCFVLVKQLGEG